MVPDSASSSQSPEGEKDILDLKADRPLEEGEAAADAPAAASRVPFTADEDLDPASASLADEVPQDRVLPETDEGEPTVLPHPEPAVAAADRRGAPATSTLIGTGILGGLVALALAGSMQYAGYLPATGDARSGAASSSEEVAALRSEVDGLKQQLATLPVENGPDPALEKRITALEGNAGQGTAPENEARLKALEDRISALQDQSSKISTSGDEKLGALAARLAAAEKTLKEKPGEAAVSKAIAATYLKAAVDRGDPFLTELQTFAALSPDDPAIAELKPLAAAGVKSKTDLAKEFEAAARSALEATDQPVQGESMSDRLLASARSLISVRPVGNVEGTDTGAILARMDDKLRNGDAKGAALEWDGLPEPARKASAAFKADLDKRIKADDLTRALAERSATPAVNAG